MDRPGLFGCDDELHPKPDTAQEIAGAIEQDIRGRRGLRQAFEGIDDEIKDNIRDQWVEAIRAFIG